MAKLVLKLEPSRPTLKMAIESCHLRDVPDDCQIYLFYFPSTRDHEDLEKALLKWGKTTGKNLFVGLWGMDDPNYRKVAQTFEIGPLPAIVVTGAPWSASTTENSDPTTAYARVDNKQLLANKDKALDSMERLYNYFIRGLVKEAVRNAKRDGMLTKLGHYLGKMKDWLGRAISNFLKTHKITVNAFKGTIDVSPV
jgi:hypothetical protein